MIPTHAQAFEVLLLQAAGDHRNATLFGGRAQRVLEMMSPFLVGEKFPEIYLEFPLAGKPFLDATVLYGDLPEGTCIDSPLATGCEDALAFQIRERSIGKKVALGFEIDCSDPAPSAAGIHFQPLMHTDLVLPFCKAAGNPEKAPLYLAQSERMPDGWPLAFFGMFRGRSDSPLRVCGYLRQDEARACAADPNHLGSALKAAGFTAFDETMLAQASRILKLAPATVDFQFDVLADGSLGDMFAIDIRFNAMPSGEVVKSFAEGVDADIMGQLQEWGIADERVSHVADMCFTRGLRLQADDGSFAPFAFSLIPGWLKVRWRGGVLQPAKIYMNAGAKLLATGAH